MIWPRAETFHILSVQSAFATVTNNPQILWAFHRHACVSYSQVKGYPWLCHSCWALLGRVPGCGSDELGVSSTPHIPCSGAEADGAGASGASGQVRMYHLCRLRMASPIQIPQNKAGQSHGIDKGPWPLKGWLGGVGDGVE